MDDDGDNHLSTQDRHLWSLIYSTMIKFECLVIFRKMGPWSPEHKDCHIDFFIPRHHPQAAQVKEYLEHEVKGLVYIRRQREDDWHPNTHVRVMLFSGLDPYLDRDVGEELAERMTSSFIQSLREELTKTESDADDDN